MTKRQPWSTDELDALIFDLDGVITQTAALHMRAWKQLFDEYLREYRTRTGEAVELYNGKEDYLEFIDGVPRYDGVRNLLESRGIRLPWGNPDDPPGKETVCGLGNQKNRMFLEFMEKDGVQVFEDTIEKINQWRREGLSTAVISSSKNCKPILETAGIGDLFDVRVDGVISEEEQIRGKPAPDIFLEAARRLGADPSRSAVFEDAVSGVKAGAAGEFRYVVGVARKNPKEVLYRNGATIAIHSFNELH